MKNVLICLSSFSRGNGVAKFIMNHYSSLVQKRYSIDFLLVNEGISDEKYIDQIKKNNGIIYYIDNGSVTKRVKNTCEKMNEILRMKEYDIVHVNLVDLYAYGCILEAKRQNIRKIIYHVHNPYTIGKLLFLRNILNYRCISMSSELVACTEETGKSMFKKNKFTTIRNAIYVENYKFTEKNRELHRKKFDLENKFVVGAVGRLTSQKNPLFALKVFEEIKREKNNAFFVWVGSGNLKEDLIKYAKKNNIYDSMLIIESRDDINEIYSAFDIFLLPSRYEGLGIVFLEAQCSGLPIYASNKVPSEVKKCDLVNFIELNRSAKEWAKTILKSYVNYDSREKYWTILKGSDYDIEKNKKSLIELYGE